MVCHLVQAEDTDCWTTSGLAYPKIDGYEATYSRSCAEQAEYGNFSDEYDHLLGCQGISGHGTLDGFWFNGVRPDLYSGDYDTDIDYDPTNGTCNVWNGGTRGSGSRTFVSCCKTPTKAMTCKLRFGAPGQTESNTTCGTDYTMTSCTVWQDAAGQADSSQDGRTIKLSVID